MNTKLTSDLSGVKGLKAWYSAQRDIEGYCKDLKRCDTVEEAEKIGGDIDWATFCRLLSVVA